MQADIDRIRDAVQAALLATQTTLAIIRHARRRTEAEQEHHLCSFALVEAEDHAEHLAEELTRIAASLPPESQPRQLWLEPDNQT